MDLPSETVMCVVCINVGLVQLSEVRMQREEGIQSSYYLLRDRNLKHHSSAGKYPRLFRVDHKE